MLAACTKSYDWNQKLTLYITTPSGEVVASSVIRIDATDTTSKFFPVEARKFQNKSTGEAVVADLGQGRYLFALLKNKSGNPVDQIHEAYSDVLHEPRRAFWGKWVRVLKQQEEPGVLPPRAYPMLVTFDDVTDPKSVRLVDPADLAASFGAGYALRKITLEITDEPVTLGVVEGVFDYFTWPKDKRYQYTCDAYGCGTNPIRITYRDGRYDSLTKSDFYSE